MIKEEGENLGQKKHSENLEVMRMQTEITWPENRQAQESPGRRIARPGILKPGRFAADRSGKHRSERRINHVRL